MSAGEPCVFALNYARNFGNRMPMSVNG